MRKAIIVVLAIMMLAMPWLNAFGAEDFVVGSLTQLSGNFFTDMWGNNASDIDVRTLIHGYSTVVKTEQADYEFDKNVVKSWRARENRAGDKTYTIQIHDDLSYNTGQPIDASDYVFSILMQGSPEVRKLGGLLSAPLDAIVGFEDYNIGEKEVFEGVRLLDSHSFSIKISREVLPNFNEKALLSFMPYPISVIAPGSRVQDDGEGAYIMGNFSTEILGDTLLNPHTGYMSHPQITAGPYRLDSYDRDANTAYFSINRRYKGDANGQKPSISNIVLKQVELSDMMEALEAGEVQLINKVSDGISIEKGYELINDSKINHTNYLRSGLGFISFANEMGPTQFKAVRQAISYALDKEKFVEEYTDDYGQQVHGYTGLGQWMVSVINNYEARRYDPRINPWTQVNMNDLNHYEQNLAKAKSLLTSDGWNFNEKGEYYVESTDSLRYKKVAGELMPLEINWARAEGSLAGIMLEELLAENMESLGMKLNITEMPFNEMLKHYYRQADRSYHMFNLATNFEEIFDPYMTFNVEDRYQGSRNTTGLRDAKLMELAKKMRETEPGDTTGYLEKWMEFQLHFNELLPLIPLYSNIYFDFFDVGLVDYHSSETQSWANAILYASYSR